MNPNNVKPRKLRHHADSRYSHNYKREIRAWQGEEKEKMYKNE